MGKTKKHQWREGTPSDNGPDDPLTGGEPTLNLIGGRDDPPGGATGGGEDDRQGGGKRATIRGGGGSSFTLDGQDDAADATPLAPPLLLLSSSSSSAIAEEDVAGGVPSSVDPDLNAVPANKEDDVDADDDRAMVAAVIAMPDTTGGNDAMEAIVLALLSSTWRALIVISLVMNTLFSSFNDVDLPHSMLVDCSMICCRECGPIAAV